MQTFKWITVFNSVWTGKALELNCPNRNKKRSISQVLAIISQTHIESNRTEPNWNKLKRNDDRSTAFHKKSSQNQNTNRYLYKAKALSCAFIKYTDKDKLIHNLIVLRELFDAIIASVNQIETPPSESHRQCQNGVQNNCLCKRVLGIHLFFKSIDSFGILFKL